MDTNRINRILFLLFIFLQVLSGKENIRISSETMLDSMRTIQYSNPSSALKLGLNILKKESQQPISQVSAKTKYTLGEILQDQGLPNQALEYYVEALDEYFVLEDFIAIGWVYVNMGNVYFHQNLFEDAAKKYENALKVFKEIKLRSGEATAINNLALIAIELFDLDRAIALFFQGLEARIEYNDLGLIAHSYLYIGEVYLEKDKKRKAMDYFQKALEIGMETDTLNLIGDSHRKIGLTYFYLNDDSLAMINFRMAEADYTAKSNKNYQIQLYTQMAALFHSKSDFKSEEKYLQKALVIANKQGYIKHEIDILGDLVLLPDWILAKIEQIELYTKLDLLHQTRFETEMKKTLIRSELKLDLEKYKRNLIRKEAEITQAVFARNVSIAIGILLVLLLAALFNRYQYKKRSNAIMLTQKDEIHFQKMKVENLNSEASKRALKYEIDLKKRELVLNATFLQQKNDLIIHLKKNLEYKMNLLSDPEEKKYFKSILASMDESNKSEEQWKDFEAQFAEVYPGYFQLLLKEIPDLTSIDLKLCAYLKMNMNTKEIAQMTGLSVRAIENRRYRLRKKINISNQTSLERFLGTLETKII